MHKLHWTPALLAAAAGLALSAIPSNSAHGSSQKTTIESAEIAEGSLAGGELIHGVVVLAIVIIAVGASHIFKRKA